MTAAIMVDKVWLLPAIMFLSFLAILFLGKRSPGKGHAIGIAAVGLCTVLALVTAGEWVARETGHEAATALDDVPAECSASAAELSDGSHGGEGDHGDDAGEGEHALAPGGAVSIADGESAAPAAEEGETEHYTRPVVRCATWWSSGQTDITVGTQVDGLVVMMLMVVTIISLLVHIFSTDYVHGDRRYTHYFAFLSLFTASMLFFVMSQSTIQMIVGWELVGVCSFALIGHWWEDKPNSDAALKAFLTNRVGDIGLLVGMITLFFASGKTFSIMDINIKAAEGQISQTALTVAAVALIAAVMSKSGQFILHTWLPDAMAGPTPVSALIHAATMVVAGIYMVARLYPVFFEGLSIAGGSFNLLAIVGSVTAVFGALLGFVQKDIKKVLAYSTISQLGFMVAALGVGAWTAAVFHLFTHAFFKACLFLGAGSLSHACHHSFNMVDDMGGLRKVMPRTFWTYVIAAASLSGIFPLAGFWSKDEILAGTGGINDGVGNYYIVLAALLIGAFCTAGYMTRSVWYAFYGEYRGHHEPHESGPRITVPLIILATLAVVAGFANLPAKIFVELPSWLSLRFEHFVEPVGAYFPGKEAGFTHAEFNPLLALISLVVALSAAAIVWSFYLGKFPSLVGLASRNRFARTGKRILENKYYLDWLYTDVIVGFVKGPLARATYWVNQRVIDATVDGVGMGAAKAGDFVYNRIDQGVVDGAVNGAGALASGSGGGLSRMQTGKVQQYGVLLFAGTAILTGILVAVLTA
ncbi:MAG: NADH-quinone oxidoreductase subunit L [Microthrixaceae bacterium]